MKVLAIGAHPDDLEILCGGTLARYAREGAEVTMCSVANGNRGSFVHSREEIAAIRAREAAASAELLGSRYVTLGVGDTELNAADETQRLAVTELIRSVDPDVVITHYNQDYMPDHNEVSNLVEAAIFFATVPLYETDSAPTVAVAPLYFMDTLGGVGFVPTEYVDISDVHQTKLDALGCHESQVGWLLEHDGTDTLGNTRISDLYRGNQCGVKAAEGFRQSLRYLRLRTSRLLP